MTAAGLARLGCPRCGREVDPADPDVPLGCPACRAAGAPVNLVCLLDPATVARAFDAVEVPGISGPGTRTGVWRWADALPVPVRHGTPLGEGGTPLIAVPRLGVPGLLVKNEAANPTWSHKDRLAALAVAAARALGRDTVTAASTGNHGAAVAAAAARAGLRCVLFTVPGLPATMSAFLRGYGARVVEAPTLEHRYELMAAGIAEHGWFPASNAAVPPVGSSPYGVDGYKTLAYELWAQLGGRAPDLVVLPVAIGDLLSGVARGFADLHRAGRIAAVPRLAAAEVTGALGRALRPGAPIGPVPRRATAAFSIGGTWTTRQAVDAVTSTGGTVVAVSERELADTRAALAGTEGLLAEAASCAAVAAAGRAAAGLPDGATVVAVLTSSGLKDSG